MVTQKVRKTLNLSQSLASIFLFIGIIVLIFNFSYARYSKVSMSPAVIIFFVVALIWYTVALKIINQSKSIRLIDNLGGRGEKILKKNLQAGEGLIAKLKGSFGEAFVVTDHNIYVVKWGFMTGQFFGGRCNCYPFQRIVGIEYKKNLISGTVEVLTAANQNIRGMSYWGMGANSAIQSDNAVSFLDRDHKKFQEVVNRARELMTDKLGAVGSGRKDDLDQLEKLAVLKEKGIITNEEFDAKKKMILGL